MVTSLAKKQNSKEEVTRIVLPTWLLVPAGVALPVGQRAVRSPRARAAKPSITDSLYSLQRCPRAKPGRGAVPGCWQSPYSRGASRQNSTGAALRHSLQESSEATPRRGACGRSPDSGAVRQNCGAALQEARGRAPERAGATGA